MKNLFKESEFMLGVTKFKNLPEDMGDEILLAGRSNAGKSSALNALTENPKLARISKTPGRTTEINFFRVNEGLKFVDFSINFIFYIFNKFFIIFTRHNWL